MSTVSVSEAKNRLCALLDEVREGGSVYITDRGRPVARLEPIPAETGSDDTRLAALERRGLVVRPKQPVAVLKRFRPVAARRRVDLGETVLEERREGR
jgi:prevent-host-death family protein